MSDALRDWLIVGGVAFVVGVVIALLVIVDERAESKCLDAGRAWAKIGSHTNYVWDQNLKTMMPQTVTDYGCVDWKK